MHAALLLPHQDAIARLCRRHGVARLELFGSAASGEFMPGHSDYDFLYELAEGVEGSRASRLLAFAQDLENLLGSHVDLVNPRYIRNPYFAQEVERTRVPVYG